MNEAARERVLVVDDDPAIRALVAKLLERDDFEVEVASDGAQALAMIEEDARYAVIVLDLMMPKMSGFEVLNRLRERHPPGVKCFVVMSAIGRPIRAADRDQVCAIVEKPFDLTAVTAAVRDCIQGHEV